jgi:serine O-acetyltransferase
MNAIYFHRLAHWLQGHGTPLLPKILHRLIFLIFNCSIPPQTRIGSGSWLAYGGMGVVIHADARLGSRVFVSQQVTIGGRSGSRQMPVIEDDVYLGPGCRILGPITIGRGVLVAPNAVVIEDVPPDVTVGGIPARVLKKSSDATRIIAAIRS